MKHANETEKSKSNLIFKIILITLIFFIAIGFTITYLQINKTTENKPEIIKSSNEFTTIENERIVLKSNFEEDREKILIYTFKDNIVDEYKVYEKYENNEKYRKQKEELLNMEEIKILDSNDKTLELYYQKLDLKDDDGLTYQDIYNKYMGIIGAFDLK